MFSHPSAVKKVSPNELLALLRRDNFVRSSNFRRIKQKHYRMKDK